MKSVSLSSLPLAALVTASWLSVLSPGQAAKIGINIQDDWDSGGGAPVTDTSFGIPAADWFNLPRVTNSIGQAFSTSTTISLPGAGDLFIEWSAVNTYSMTGDVPATPGADPGADQVTYGYLDDTGTGYRFKITGLRNSAADYKVTLIAATDGGSGFTDANVVHSSGTDTLSYGESGPAIGGGIYALSAESPIISALAGNNSIAVSGVPRSGTLRSTLAGVIIDYTPTTTNPPLIEVPPAAPPATLFTGQTLTLSVTASGNSLSYQWRRNGSNLSGQTSSTFTKLNATPADDGNYDVVVSGIGAPAISTALPITISPLTQPIFTVQPVPQTFYSGYPATFSSTATGGELSYTWKKDNVLLPGETASTLSLATITTADAGSYTVTASNAVGSTSTSATLTVLTPVPGSYEAVQAAQKPLLWYRYSETANLVTNTSTVANSGTSGAAATGTAKRYLAFQEPGALTGDAANKSAGIKSNSQFIDIPYTPDLNTPSFTAELWVKAPPTGATVRFDPLCNRGAATADGFLFFGGNGVTKWQFRVYNGTTRSTINSLSDVAPGVWTHLVGTFDSATGTQRFFVNGVQEGEFTGVTYIPNAAMPLRLAAFPNDNGDVGGGSFAGGGLDEIAIYPTALSPADVTAHYQNGTNASRATPYAALVQSSTPAGYWRMDDPAGPIPPTPRNSGTAGAGWTGSYGGDLVPVTTGPAAPEDPGFGPANQAVGTTLNGYNAVPPLNITTNTITVTTWVKRAEIFESLDDLSWAAWLGAGGGFHIDGTDGRPYGELRYHWDGSQWGWGSGLQVPANIWTFCALVIEPTRATVYMGDGDTLRKSSVSATHTPHLLNQALAFGGNQLGRTSRNYVGQLDESAVYARALSEIELTSLFINGSGAPFSMEVKPGGVVDDTKPTGTPIPGLTGSTWLASSTDILSKTRDGVQEFSLLNADAIQVPVNADLDSPTGTIMFWMKSGLPTGTGSDAAIIYDRRTTAGTVIGIADSGSIYVQCNPGGTNVFTDNSYIADEVWHHIAITYNQDAAGSIAIYVDGVAGTENFNANAWSWPAATGALVGESRDPYWKRFNGQIDEFRIYNQVLSGAEIAQIASNDSVAVPTALKLRYAFGTAGSGLTLTWPFGILETSTMQPGDPWTPVSGATSPLPILPSNPARFYRAKLP
ncbi:MAG: hypothetical protein JWL81_2445 [Verrucomicrobiales bacterium]|nr:hypothetical protein [Verrucomicrobiales bacterium]